MRHWTNDHRDWYWDVYIQSDHWRELKAAKLKQAPVCERCGNAHNLDVHHINYRDLFNVTLADLETLCRACHEQEHIENGRPVRSKEPLRRSQDLPSATLQSNHASAISEFERFSQEVLTNLRKGRRVKHGHWVGLENKLRQLRRSTEALDKSIRPEVTNSVL